MVIYPTTAEMKDICSSTHFYDADLDVSIQYMQSLENHIAAVVRAGEIMGIDADQLARHDASKYSKAEFEPYAQKFFGTPDEQSFKDAWLHHLHNNPHHWQHWVLMNDEEGWEAVWMPPHFTLEMIADWHGAGRAYQGHWDISEWFNTRFKKNLKWFHDETKDQLFEFLEWYGYGRVNGNEIELIESKFYD